MLGSFFINAIRNMKKHSGYLILNITGLTIGLTSFLLITIYVLNELSFDRFHKNYENIYRIKVKGLMAGATLDQAITAAPMAQAILADYPEISHAVRINRSGAWLVNMAKHGLMKMEFFLPIHHFSVYSILNFYEVIPKLRLQTQDR